MDQLTVANHVAPTADINFQDADAAGGLKRQVIRSSDETMESEISPDTRLSQSDGVANSRTSVDAYPFFSYIDHSRDVDRDPMMPLTPPGRVPNFPAKMHSILSRSEFSDVVGWMPHGRSWRVLKPRDFESRVLPIYFGHAKFSSFIRQANGWGFRRITKGPDEDSYYHERFLRCLPHLCKSMKQAYLAKKPLIKQRQEPDFYRIAEIHPLPEKCDDVSILLQCTVAGGPRARMPIYTGEFRPIPSKHTGTSDHGECFTLVASSSDARLTPSDKEILSSFESSLGACENEFKPLPASLQIARPPSSPSTNLPSSVLKPSTGTASFNWVKSHQHFQLAAASEMAFDPQIAAVSAFHAVAAASHFAAGFAAATALSQQQFRSLMESFNASLSSSGSYAPSRPQRSPQRVFTTSLLENEWFL